MIIIKSQEEFLAHVISFEAFIGTCSVYHGKRYVLFMLQTKRLFDFPIESIHFDGLGLGIFTQKPTDRFIEWLQAISVCFSAQNPLSTFNIRAHCAMHFALLSLRSFSIFFNQLLHILTFIRFCVREFDKMPSNSLHFE